MKNIDVYYRLLACLNPNVAIYTTSQFFLMAGFSVWGYSLLSNIMYIATRSTLKIGFAEGVQGTISGIFAIPFGILADRYIKHKIVKSGALIRVCCCIGFLCVFNIPKIETDKELFFWLLFATLSFYGLSSAILCSPSATLFTNSICTGDRSWWLSKLQIVSCVGLSTGPLISIIILNLKGTNDWTMNDMKIPWNVSVVLTLIGTVLQIFMNDKWCLDEELNGNISVLDKVVTEEKCIKESHIPYIVALSDFIFGIGSGMTSKFFPLFFQKEVGFTPINLQLLFVIGYFSISILTYVAQLISKKIGRVQTCLLMSYLGLVYFLVIIIINWDNSILIGVMYVLRLSFSNCTLPLHKSIVDDYVDTNKRGCWNSIEFIFVLGWSGSAALGGWLISAIGYQFTFLITFLSQFVAISVYWLLIGVVSKEERSLKKFGEIELDTYDIENFSD